MKDKKKVSIKFVIIIAVISLILGGLIMFLLNSFIFNKNKAVVSIKGYKMSKIDLYEKMKGDYALTYALEEIDNRILEEKYPLSDEEKQEIKDEAQGYIDTYITYGYSQEDFLKMYGFKDYDDFIEDLMASKRQEKFYVDYAANLIGEDKIKEYYNTEGNIYGDINSKHILVEVTPEVSEEQAKSLANTIISELDSGSSWDDIVEKYSGETITENLGFQGFDNNLEKSFMDALISMEDNSYSKEPVKTSYGYHIIYRLDSADKPTYEEARTRIISKLSKDFDQASFYKAYFDLEKEYGIKFYDKELKTEYEKMIDSFNNN